MRVLVLGLPPRRHALTEGQARTVRLMSRRRWMSAEEIGVRGSMIARPNEQLGELLDLGIVDLEIRRSAVGVITTRYRLRWRAIRTEG